MPVDVRLLLVLSVLMGSSAAWAGEHISVCVKAQQAELVVEIEFRPRGSYPKAHVDKGWGPPESALKKTRATGQIHRVFKGDVAMKGGVPRDWPIEFSPGNPRLAQWQRFFARKQFRQIVYLAQRGETWRRVGGAEDSAGCGSSANRSWCPGYQAYIDTLSACLKNSVSPEVLARVCTAPCSGPMASVAVWRDAEKRVQRLRHRADPMACSHGPDTYFDGTGTLVDTLPERPLSPEEAALLQVERRKRLAGLVPAETLSCPRKRVVPPRSHSTEIQAPPPMTQ